MEAGLKIGRESLEKRKARAAAIHDRLAAAYPDATCSLDFQNPLQLMISTILAAQCTDERVNKVTPALFKRFKTAEEFAEADQTEVETYVQSCGFYRNKAKNIIAACRKIVERHGGQVPGTLESLTQLDGVGRKTANVILGECFNTRGVVVDTHCGRLSRRLGFTRETDPEKVERDLMKIWHTDHWNNFSHCLVFHGRAVCDARSPKCSVCPVRDLCPYPLTADGKKIAK
ncbi:MAG: endonuclease III [Candidatus Hydrogenedentota bacterium]